MKHRSAIIRLLVLTVLMGAIGWLALHRELLQAAALEERLGSSGRWAPILFVVLYACATVLFVPGFVLTWRAVLSSARCGEVAARRRW